MKRAVLTLILAASGGIAGCDKQPASCMVNEDCGERLYCDAPLASTSDLSCVVAQPGVCRPEDSSTYDAPCADHSDCKLRGFLCGSGAQMCTTFSCLTDPGFVVRPEDCQSGCTFGRRNYTCVGCFCPAQCTPVDAASPDGP